MVLLVKSNESPDIPEAPPPYLIVSAIGVSTDEYVESATPVECVGPRTPAR